jgi:topoisomerase-4 subunit B
MDEALGKFAKNIKIILNENGSVVVEDDGRGIPIGNHSSGMTALEVIFTKLHAGGKFSSNAYKVSGGLNGVGASVVNALSDELIATVYRDGYEYVTVFHQGGKLKQTTTKVGSTTKRGTKIVFLPSYSIFQNAKFNFDVISERLRESSFLIPNIQIKL